jgi:hypothetical protein
MCIVGRSVLVLFLGGAANFAMSPGATDAAKGWHVV